MLKKQIIKNLTKKILFNLVGDITTLKNMIGETINYKIMIYIKTREVVVPIQLNIQLHIQPQQNNGLFIKNIYQIYLN